MKLKWKMINKEELERLYWGEKLSQRQIAKELNCSDYTVWFWMKKYNIPRRTNSETHKGEKNHNFGKHHSKETKRKLRDAVKGEKSCMFGKYLSDATKKKISESLKGEKSYMFGKHHSKEVKRKISEKLKGKEVSEKTKTKLSKALKGKYIGENNSQWLGGKSFEPYGLDFNNELKEQIRKRDNFTCQGKKCKYIEKQLGRKLSVHHIDYNKQNNKPKNLISLCNSCHTQTNYKRDNWTNYFKNKILNV